MQKIRIRQATQHAAINIALDTIEMGKQALVFCGTRRSAEATAEKIAELIDEKKSELDALSDSVLNALSTPTRQCKRLAFCVRKGIAFHHAGLTAKQRKMIEESFRKGILKIISSTPTLALGINMPAFRSVIKDLKRYGGMWGMDWIPTLEYHQMAGRAGRPDYNDRYGEAICIAEKESDIRILLERYINAPPENIISKMAAEPMLRSYCLSLIALRFSKSREELMGFFRKTFYAKQYGDIEEISRIIDRILNQLEEWDFIRSSSAEKNFVSALDFGKEKLEPTMIGKRVAELYIDPYTAHMIITSLRRATQKAVNELSFIHLATTTLELRPLPSVRVSEAETIESWLSEISPALIVMEPSLFEPEYNDFLKSAKLALVLNEWMEEKNEDELLEGYNISPGELHLKRELCDWVLYAAEELAMIMEYNMLIKIIRKARFRLEKGIKEELIPLARIKNIGRIRARTLFRNGIRDIGDIKRADITKLSQLLGKQVAFNLKKDLGVKLPEEVSRKKRKGQLGLAKYE